MIKTVSINLGGIVFQIDEDAFEALSKYLDSVTQYYKYQEGRDDIVSDIESRFAEIFSESLEKTGFDVISMGDVEEVIEIMGRPEDFDGEGDRFETDDDEPLTSGKRRRTRGKVLYRDKERGVLAGVCSGLAAYWGMNDALWLRIAFIAVTLFSGGIAGPLIYIILWIVVPEAKTSAQQLEMQGEPVNLTNLEKKIRSEIGEAGERITDFANNEASSGLRTIVNGIGRLFGAVAKLVWVVLKIAFAVFVIGMIIALIASIIAALLSFIISIPVSLKYIFTGVGSWLLGVFGGFLVLIIPLMFLIYLPFRIYGKHRVRNSKITTAGVGLFTAGVIMCFAAASIVASYFSERESYATQEVVPYPLSDTLFLSMNEDESAFSGLDHDIRFGNLLSFTKDLETASDWVELDIVPSTDGNIYLERNYRARGRNVKDAKENASSISYNAAISDGEIQFNSIFGLGDKQKWRSQSVKLRLKVPEGLVIVPSHDITSILDDADNSLNASMYTVAGNRWKMHNGSLEPIDSILSLGSNWNKRNMERMNFTDFDKIDIRGDVDVELVQADIFEVYMVEGSGSDRDLDVEKEGSTLTITREGWNWGDASIGFLSRDGVDPKFYISLPDLTGLDVHRQAYVSATGMTLENLTLDIGGQSTIIFEGLEAVNLTADIHGQSDLEIVGEAKKFNLDASGQSNFDGVDFSVNRLKIEMSGQSDAEMVVNEFIEGELYGQSDFEYWGDPEVDISSYGQSDVDKRD